jgi:hypothetical protein
LIQVIDAGLAVAYKSEMLRPFFETEDLDRLAAKLASLFRDSALDDAVMCSRQVMGGVERLNLETQGDGAQRYLRVTPVADLGLAWSFEVLLGEYGNANPGDDRDGRRGGTEDYVVRLARHWFVDWGTWAEMPGLEGV